MEAVTDMQTQQAKENDARDATLREVRHRTIELKEEMKDMRKEMWKNNCKTS